MTRCSFKLYYSGGNTLLRGKTRYFGGRHATLSSKRRRETASRNGQQSTRKYTCTRCAHGTSQALQVRTIHPRPGKTVISVFRSVHRATVLLYLMLQEIIEQMTAAAKKRQIEIPIGCGSLAECTARSYVSRTSCNISHRCYKKPSISIDTNRADP